MKTVTGFALTRNGVQVTGVYMDELLAKIELEKVQATYPDDELYIIPMNVYSNDSDDTGAFGYKRIDGTWYLSKYEGMGNTAYYNMSDNEALVFAEAVYTALDKLPGDLYKSILKVHLLKIMSEADKAIEVINERKSK